MTSSNESPTVFRSAGISYLHIPSNDLAQSASFYQNVFGWTVRIDSHRASFEDGTGHVIGAWVSDRSVSGDTGVLPYVFVESVDQVLERVAANGGRMVVAPYPEGDLRVATFSDPSGTVVGVWQRG